MSFSAAPILDPLTQTVLALVMSEPATTEQVCQRMAEAGSMAPPSRISAALHALHKNGKVELRRHCNIKRPRLPVVQIWHLPGVGT